MTASVLVNGTLFKNPESRTSKTGRQYVIATLKERDGTDCRFWKIFAFSENVCAEFLRLGDGDAVAVQGALKAEIYTRDGEPSVSFSIAADNVLAARQPKAKRESKVKEPKPTKPAGDPCPFDDDLAF